MIKKLRKYVTSKDEFGKAVSLNVDGDEEHKTRLGAFFTLAITGLMVVYVALLFKKLINHEEDVMDYRYPDISPEELGEIPLGEVHEIIFFELATNFRHGEFRDDAHHDYNDLSWNDINFHKSLDVKFE